MTEARNVWTLARNVCLNSHFPCIYVEKCVTMYAFKTEPAQVNFMFNNTNYSFLLHPRQCVESCRGLYGSGGYSGYNSQVKYLLPSLKCP
jgi:hypothetical protein